MGSGQRKKTPPKTAAPPKSAIPPIRREVGGGVCLLLALCVVVSYFQADAIVLNLLGNLLKGLAGYGYWLAAPALALAGVLFWVALVRARRRAARGEEHVPDGSPRSETE